MKTIAILLLALILSGLIWLSLGWVAYFVIPSLALFALMAFAPLITNWAQREETAIPSRAVEKRPALPDGGYLLTQRRGSQG